MTTHTSPLKAPPAGGARAGGATPAARPPRRPRSVSPANRSGWTPWLYLLPALVLLAGLLVYPIYQLGLISFLEYTQAQVSGGEPTTFQGFGNYATLFNDSQFWQVLLATVLFAAACVVSTLFVGCALAVLLTRIRALPRLALMMAALGAWATPRSPAPPSGSSSSTPTSDRSTRCSDSATSPGRTAATAPSRSCSSKSCGARSRS